MLTLHNYMDFVDLTEYAALTYQVSCDGEVIDSSENGAHVKITDRYCTVYVTISPIV